MQICHDLGLDGSSVLSPRSGGLRAAVTAAMRQVFSDAGLQGLGSKSHTDLETSYGKWHAHMQAEPEFCGAVANMLAPGLRELGYPARPLPPSSALGSSNLTVASV